MEYFCLAERLVVLDEPLYYYLHNPASVTRNYLPDYMDTFRTFLEAKRALVHRYGLEKDDPGWADSTCWAGLLIAIGNEYAPGNPAASRDKRRRVEAFTMEPDMAHAIRSIRQKYLTPIIVLSARTTEQDKIEALDLGANDYITKPFGTGELLARVRAALRVNRYGGGSLPGGVFSAQGLTINYERRKVFVDGQEVRLTQTEYNIVAFLSEHAGRVMTYAAIVRAIWGDTDASSTKKLQVNMANIRKKLGSRPGSNTYILNELGVGYRMIEEDAKPLEPAEETK